MVPVFSRVILEECLSPIDMLKRDEYILESKFSFSCGSIISQSLTMIETASKVNQQITFPSYTQFMLGDYWG